MIDASDLQSTGKTPGTAHDCQVSPDGDGGIRGLIRSTKTGPEEVSWEKGLSRDDAKVDI